MKDMRNELNKSKCMVPLYTGFNYYVLILKLILRTGLVVCLDLKVSKGRVNIIIIHVTTKIN